MDNRIEKMKELMQDEAFVNELVTKETPEDAQLFFEEHGVEMTLDECRGLYELLDKVANGEISEETLKKAADGELTEEELEAVAGGCWITALGVIAIVALFAAPTARVGYKILQGEAALNTGKLFVQ